MEHIEDDQKYKNEYKGHQDNFISLYFCGVFNIVEQYKMQYKNQDNLEKKSRDN